MSSIARRESSLGTPRRAWLFVGWGGDTEAVTTQILFVQGGGAGAHDEWDNKLVDSLERELGRDYDIRYPRMPNEGDPAYEPWRAALEQEFAALDRDAVLVGHSIGGTILVTTLAERRTRSFGGLFLLDAPFVGASGWPSDEMPPFPDLASGLPKAMPIYLYHGTEDETAPPAHVDLYARAIPHAQARKLGQDLVLPRDFIKHEFRGIAQDVATEWLGKRTPEQERLALDREVRRHAPTRLDTIIDGHAPDGRVDLKSLIAPNLDPALTQAAKARVQELARMGLGQDQGSGLFQLAPDWRDKLKAMEFHLDIRKRVMRDRVERSIDQQRSIERQIGKGLDR